MYACVCVRVVGTQCRRIGMEEMLKSLTIAAKSGFFRKSILHIHFFLRETKIRLFKAQSLLIEEFKNELL